MGDVHYPSLQLNAATAQIPAEEHERFLTALEEIERESKDAVRKQWGILEMKITP